jgi:uncharacterized integral membrane protein
MVISPPCELVLSKSEGAVMTSASVGKSGKKDAGERKQNPIVAFLLARWLPLLILVVVLVFIFSNAQKVSVHFLGAHFEARLWLMLLITAVLGFLAGWLFAERRQGKKAAAGKS